MRPLRPRAVHRLLLVLVLLATGCAAGDPDALEPSSPCTDRHTTDDGPVLLQEPPRDVSGPFRYARTDGACGLLVAFVGAPEGDGPCNVAEYVGRLEPAGEDLRLVVEARHTGPAPDGTTACTALGAQRSLRLTHDEPLAGRRIVDEKGQPVHLVDGDRLLRPGALPAGWTTTQEGTNVGGPGHWSFGLRGPSGQWGELRQGPPQLARTGGGHGYEVVDRPTVRGVQGVLGDFTAERTGNRLLTWVEGDRGFALQVLGPLDDPQVLVEIAEGLEG